MDYGGLVVRKTIVASQCIPFTIIKSISFLITFLLLIIVSVPNLAIGDDSLYNVTYKAPQACSQWIEELEKYPWDVVMMIQIMHLESRCRANAVGDSHLIFSDGINGISCGLLQIRILPERKVTCKEMKNPKKNIAMAYAIFKTQNYDAWSVYKDLVK